MTRRRSSITTGAGAGFGCFFGVVIAMVVLALIVIVGLVVVAG